MRSGFRGSRRRRVLVVHRFCGDGCVTTLSPVQSLMQEEKRRDNQKNGVQCEVDGQHESKRCQRSVACRKEREGHQSCLLFCHQGDWILSFSYPISHMDVSS
jgi:hypothetical protein